MKKFLSFVLLTLFMSAIMVGCADPKPQTLSAPVVTLSQNQATWSRVDGATGYELYYNGSTRIVSNNILSYTLTVSGEFKVRAVGDNEKTLTSEWSNRIIFSNKIPTPVVTINHFGFASWEAVSDCQGYEIIVNGEYINLIQTNSYQLQDGDTIKVKVIAGYGKISSDYSEQKNLQSCSNCFRCSTSFHR